MSTNKIFIFAILASAGVHSIILAQNTSFGVLSKLLEKHESKIEVKYVKATIQNKQKPAPTGLPARNRMEPLLNLSAPKITTDKRIPPPAYVSKEELFKPTKSLSINNPALAKPNLAKPDIISIKKKVSLPPVDLEKINNPSYISYYQIVREKIRRSAYQNYTHTDTGEVYVTFVISNDGYLKESRLVEEKSTGLDYLKNLALRSVRDASPFPSFPKDLDYQQLSFNVVISFEIE